MCFLTELIVCVAYLRQKSRVNFRSTKVDAGNLKCKYLNRPRSTLAVNVLMSCNGTLWINMGNLLFKEFTYPLGTNQPSPLNRTSLGPVSP
jgi:hypothetical protein